MAACDPNFGCCAKPSFGSLSPDEPIAFTRRESGESDVRAVGYGRRL